MVSGGDALARLAVVQAVYKEVGAMVKAGGCGLRGDLDRALMDSAVRSMDLAVNGREVGTISKVRSQAADTVEVTVTDVDALTEWALDTEDGRRALTAFVAANAGRLAELAVAYSSVTEDGEVLGYPEGVESETVHREAGFKGTRLAVDERKVREALGMGPDEWIIERMVSGPHGLLSEGGEGQ